VKLVRTTHDEGRGTWDVFVDGVIVDCIHSASVRFGMGADGRTIATIEVECAISDDRG
jgi:hypothetical protein